MKSGHPYFLEFKYLKGYSAIILLVMLLSYSLYFFFDDLTIARLGDEDHFFEWTTSLCFLFCSLISFKLFFQKKNMIFLLMSAVFFFGFGEEISWGQRILGFETPGSLYDINRQKEFNMHNIATWEINFLFKSFTLAFGIILPLSVFHVDFLGNLARKLKIPVPPVSIGMFFLFDWIIFKFSLELVLHPGAVPKYYFALTEIYEFITSFILLSIFLYFYLNRNIRVEGEDIKESLYPRLISHSNN